MSTRGRGDRNPQRVGGERSRADGTARLFVNVKRKPLSFTREDAGVPRVSTDMGPGGEESLQFKGGIFLRQRNAGKCGSHKGSGEQRMNFACRKRSAGEASFRKGGRNADGGLAIVLLSGRKLKLIGGKTAQALLWKKGVRFRNMKESVARFSK